MVLLDYFVIHVQASLIGHYCHQYNNRTIWIYNITDETISTNNVKRTYTLFRCLVVL